MKRLELVISMKALLENARAVRGRVPENVKICAVVKADAYGHGAAELSRALESERLADAFAVATPEEGRALREAGVKGEILVLGLTDADGAEESVAFALSQAVDDASGLAMLERTAARQGRQAKVQLKVDTGMTRLGVRGAGELNALLKAWEGAPHVHMSGMFTHFCFADGDAAFTRAQFERFEAACAAVRAAGFAPVRHAAASTAMLDEAYQLDMVRLGIALYGTGVKALDGAVRPAQTLRTHPLRVCEIETGETVGYSRAFRAARRTRVMTIPCGYGDGYPRILSGRADVLVNGRRAPVIGNICMDMMMADVTDAGEITPESEVVLLGAQGGERITPDELAQLAETIPYEIMLGFSQRVARRFA